MNRKPRKSKSRDHDGNAKSDSSRSQSKQDDSTEDGEDIKLSQEEQRADKYRTQGERETVEAFVVAFILALLFRAFIAEAFVIPTGSMAPTLMGAHKDLFCDRCDTQFQVGASNERQVQFAANGRFRASETVVAGTCPNCRHLNSLDLADNRDHHTFNGDRILVSKFAYALSDPERWDVIVFKFPGNPKQNYIKRLVGLPNETLTVRHGDIYVRPSGTNDPDQIIRKPADKLLAMRHAVYDSNQQAVELIEAKFPSRWQPWRENAVQPPADSWQIARDANSLTATVETNDDQQHWLRYFHHWPGREQWADADAKKSLEAADPFASRLITDFYAYNSGISTDTDNVYEVSPLQKMPGQGGIGRILGTLKSMIVGPDYVVDEDYLSGGPISQFRRSTGGVNANGIGMHWVGDLILEADVETSMESKELVLEIVEAGVKYRCTIDLVSGNGKLSIDDGQPRSFQSDDGANQSEKPSAYVNVRAGSRHKIRFSNCDDQLLFWVDDELIEFDAPTTFDVGSFLKPDENHPKYSLEDPLDGAPVGLAVRGGKATVHRLRIDRDKYYIATEHAYSLHDYDMNVMRQTGETYSIAEIQQIFSNREIWSQFKGWPARRSVSFEMKDDQFFPMGDNSPASMDARCWAGSKEEANSGLPQSVEKDAYQWSRAHYVPRDLLVGKALIVFWPHPWTRPVPMTPNFKRFKLIR